MCWQRRDRFHRVKISVNQREETREREQLLYTNSTGRADQVFVNLTNWSLSPTETHQIVIWLI